MIGKFGNAFNGIVAGIKREKTIRIMMIVSAIVTIIMVMTRYPNRSTVINLCYIIIALEYMNTSIEILAHRVIRGQDKLIGLSLDIAGGSVLFMCVSSIAYAIDIVSWILTGTVMI